MFCPPCRHRCQGSVPRGSLLGFLDRLPTKKDGQLDMTAWPPSSSARQQVCCIALLRACGGGRSGAMSLGWEGVGLAVCRFRVVLPELYPCPRHLRPMSVGAGALGERSVLVCSAGALAQ